jgi:hypothetical protein
MSRRDTESQQLTAYSLQQASVGGQVRNSRSREPMAVSDVLVYELYGLTDDEIRVVEGGGA